MGRRKELTIGSVYGRWMVLSNEGTDKHHKSLVKVQCACGVIEIKERASLTTGLSGGCLACSVRRSMTHGHCKDRKASPEYWVWHSMKKRCHNPTEKMYSYYGGRGIRVCKRWRESFEAFLADVGLRPAKHLTLERIDNDGHYEPGNVKWATRFEQQSNRRSSRFRTLDDARISLSAMARHLALPREVLYKRFRRLGLCS